MSGRERLVVAHVVPDLLYGGLQRLTVQLTELVDPTRFESHVLVLGELGPLAATIGDSATVHPIHGQSRVSMIWPRLLSGAMAAIRPDVVHTHSGVWYKASLAARQAGVPWLVHTDHGRMVPDPWAARVVDRLASRRTDVVVAVSEPLAKTMRATVVADPSRVRVVANGVDTDRLRPRRDAGIRAEWGIPEDATVIGSVGRLERIKGYDVMIETLASLRRLAPDRPVRLVIAGDGDDRQELEALARARGVADQVRFLGWQQDLGRLLAGMDLFVLTSRSEGTSVSLLEAMSFGLCVVVTDVGGNADVLGPGLAHRLVPSEQPDAIAEGWLAALGSPDARHNDGAAGRRRVVERFSLRAMIAAYEAIYREGSSKAGRPTARTA
ncbi:MAG: glycosyltransferase [Gemmatimonadales bacterium]